MFHYGARHAINNPFQWAVLLIISHASNLLRSLIKIELTCMTAMNGYVLNRQSAVCCVKCMDIAMKILTEVFKSSCFTNFSVAAWTFVLL